MKANQIQPPWQFDDPRVIRRGCPACGSTDVAHVRMGLPGMSDELERLLAAGKVAFGGCVIRVDYATGHSMEPERFCNQCGTAWGRWVGPQSRWPRLDLPAPPRPGAV